MVINETLLYKQMGDRIRNLRLGQHEAGGGNRLTQADLAKDVGLERTSITNIENGTQKLPLHVLYRICGALRAEPSDVLPSISEVSVLEVEGLDVKSIAAKEASAGRPLLSQALEKIDQAN